MVKEVTVTSKMNYQMIVRNLERLGEIRVDKVLRGGDGETTVVFRERTVGEFFKENLPWNKTLALKSRQAVFDAFAPLLKNQRYSEQLLQNIQDRVQHNIGVTGYALKCDYQPVNAGRRPSPLQGGTVASIRKGNGVHLLEANPAKIKCDHAILLTSTAIAECGGNPAVSTEKKKLEDMVFDNKTKKHGEKSLPIPVKSTDIFPVNLAATNWTCITDLQIPEIQTNQATLELADLAMLVSNSLSGKQGAVVIEVIPDGCVEKSEKRTYSYTDDGLRLQMKIAKDLVDEAKKSKNNVNITFACNDRAVLERMRTLNQGMISNQKNMTASAIT